MVKKIDEQFRIIFESAPNAMILINNLGNIAMLNKQTEILFGYERSELIGEKIELLIPERFKRYHPNHRKNFHSNPKVRAMGAGRDLFALRKDGLEVPIEIGLNPIEKADGKFVLASIIDITERKKNDDALKLHAERIDAKNKELEQFTYIVSHDLREPLNSITSLVEVLMEDESFKSNEEANQILEFISQSSVRMKSLIKGLLDYARLGKNAKVKEVDFNLIVNNVIEDLDLYIKESKAKITVKKLPTLNAFEIEMRLLFQNLISNAIKYSKPNQAIEIAVSATESKKSWDFVISDNGIGIPHKSKDKIFILFKRLHNHDSYEGTGIGLAHCLKIIKLHDGEIWVESELGKGSDFCFSIPK